MHVFLINRFQFVYTHWMHEAKQFNIQIQFCTFRDTNSILQVLIRNWMHLCESYLHVCILWSFFHPMANAMWNPAEMRKMRDLCERFRTHVLLYLAIASHWMHTTTHRFKSPKSNPLAAVYILFIFHVIQLRVHCSFKSFVGKQKKEVFFTIMPTRVVKVEISDKISYFS